MLWWILWRALTSTLFTTERRTWHWTSDKDDDDDDEAAEEKVEVEVEEITKCCWPLRGGDCSSGQSALRPSRTPAFHMTWLAITVLCIKFLFSSSICQNVKNVKMIILPAHGEQMSKGVEGLGLPLWIQGNQAPALLQSCYFYRYNPFYYYYHYFYIITWL